MERKLERCNRCNEMVHCLREHLEICIATYPCLLCNQYFMTKSSLDKHAKLHENSAVYDCEFCGKSFSNRGNKNKHIKKYHSSGVAGPHGSGPLPLSGTMPPTANTRCSISSSSGVGTISTMTAPSSNIYSVGALTSTASAINRDLHSPLNGVADSQLLPPPPPSLHSLPPHPHLPPPLLPVDLFTPSEVATTPEVNVSPQSVELLMMMMTAERDTMISEHIETVHKMSSEKRKLEDENASQKSQIEDLNMKLEKIQASFDAVKDEAEETTKAVEYLKNENQNVSLQLIELREKLRYSEESSARQEQQLREENKRLLRAGNSTQEISQTTMPLMRQLESLQNTLSQRTTNWNKEEKLLLEKLETSQTHLKSLEKIETTYGETIDTLQTRCLKLEEKLANSLMQSEHTQSFEDVLMLGSTDTVLDSNRNSILDDEFDLNQMVIISTPSNSSHSSNDDVDTHTTTTSSDIEIISNPNGDSSGTHSTKRICSTKMKKLVYSIQQIPRMMSHHPGTLPAHLQNPNLIHGASPSAIPTVNNNNAVNISSNSSPRSTSTCSSSVFKVLSSKSYENAMKENKLNILRKIREHSKKGQFILILDQKPLKLVQFILAILKNINDSNDIILINFSFCPASKYRKIARNFFKETIFLCSLFDVIGIINDQSFFNISPLYKYCISGRYVKIGKYLKKVPIIIDYLHVKDKFIFKNTVVGNVFFANPLINIQDLIENEEQIKSHLILKSDSKTRERVLKAAMRNLTQFAKNNSNSNGQFDPKKISQNYIERFFKYASDKYQLSETVNSAVNTFFQNFYSDVQRNKYY